MKHLFYKVTLKGWLHDESVWMLCLDNPKRLHTYQEFKSKNLVTSYFSAKKKTRLGRMKAGHLNNEENTIVMMLTCRGNGGKKGVTAIDDINVITDTYILPMTKFFLSGKIPLVNQAGGYFFLDKNVKILDKLERDNMVWPEDDELEIKISRWPGGKHYYAKVGKYTVEDKQGNSKWNTAKDAEKEAKKFKRKILKENKL